MSGYTLRLAEDEGVVLSGAAVRKLIDGGDGDAALLYIAVLKNRGSVDEEKIRSQLRWSAERLQRALCGLSAQGLIGLPDERPLPPPEPPGRDADWRKEYTRADLARASEDQRFDGLLRAVEQKLGKKLYPPSVAILLGLYDQLGLPTDVIFLLVSFCTERVVRRYGEGRQPTMREIEKEGYIWARKGLMDQESAAAYIRECHRHQEALPRMMRLLGLDGRKPSAGEEKYLTDWMGMGFEDEAVELAYEKTVMKCKELKWPYMNRILASWHAKGLHTLKEIEAGDKPGQREARPRKPEADAAREDIARMKQYYQQLRQEKEGS